MSLKVAPQENRQTYVQKILCPRCVPASAQCSGHPECADHSDEADCGRFFFKSSIICYLLNSVNCIDHFLQIVECLITLSSSSTCGRLNLSNIFRKGWTFDKNWSSIRSATPIFSCNITTEFDCFGDGKMCIPARCGSDWRRILLSKSANIQTSCDTLRHFFLKASMRWVKQLRRLAGWARAGFSSSIFSKMRLRAQTWKVSKFLPKTTSEGKTLAGLWCQWVLHKQWRLRSGWSSGAMRNM